MLIIEQQPNPLQPHGLSGPVRWVVKKTDHVGQPGAPATFTVIIGNGGGANGQTFTIAGEQFTTDDAQPYTNTSFNYTDTDGQSGNRFVNMLRTNERFLDWTFSAVNNGDNTWTITGQAGSSGLQSGDDWVNDLSGLSPAVTFEGFAGQDLVVSSANIWYQLWSEGDPITPRRVAYLDQSGRTTIDIRNVLPAIVESPPPYLLDTGPYRLPRGRVSVYLRFGEFTTENGCDRLFGPVTESATIKIIPAVFQAEQLLQLRPYTPVYRLPVQWLTDRRADRQLCRSSFEWANVLIERSPVIAGPWTVTMTFYRSNDTTAGTVQHTITEPGLYRIPTGPQNEASMPAILVNAAAYYTIDITATDVDGNVVPYADQHRVNIVGCSCRAGEVYYLEDKGSWGTATFEKLTERRITLDSIEYERPIPYGVGAFPQNAFSPYAEGGRFNEAVEADREFTLLSPRIITHQDRVKYEQLLRAPKHYILTATDAFPTVIRRVTIDRDTYVTFNDGEAIRLAIPFRFNEPLNTIQQ